MMPNLLSLPTLQLLVFSIVATLTMWIVVMQMQHEVQASMRLPNYHIECFLTDSIGVGPTFAQRRYYRPNVGPTLDQLPLLSGLPVWKCGLS